jgi:hypothetical protein
MKTTLGFSACSAKTVAEVAITINIPTKARINMVKTPLGGFISSGLSMAGQQHRAVLSQRFPFRTLGLSRSRVAKNHNHYARNRVDRLMLSFVPGKIREPQRGIRFPLVMQGRDTREAYPRMTNHEPPTRTWRRKPMLRICLAFGLSLLFVVCGHAPAEEAETCNGLPLVFCDDFEDGTGRWETTDDNAWELHDANGGKAFGLNKRTSDYKPKVRSPHNIALIKDVKVADFVLKFKVKSTLDTGGHRDCCVFFNYQDPTHFYYVHLGARPDPHSGQIMIVNDAPRVALTKNTKETPWDDDWHEVKVVRDGKVGTIEIYFDDMKTPHMKTNDKTFGKGRIGIGSFDDMNDFDDVKLYGQ